MSRIRELQKKLYQGGACSKMEIMSLAEEPLDELCQAADEIRRHFCGNAFDLCAVISARGGPCSEDCRFCAQSGANPSCREVPRFSLLGTEKLLEDAMKKDSRGMMAYGIVSSGRVLPSEDVEKLCHSLRLIRQKTSLRLCGSLGLLGKEDLEKLKAAGMQMIHNNLESSETYFERICTTHTYEEKKATIRAAKEVGLAVCSGGLFGIGETLEDRIELAVNERELGVDSVPVNLLDPATGTPFEGAEPLREDEIRRTIALLRFALPDVFIRLAAGREYLPDKGRSCFMSGANAVISGDFLTTMGISIDKDLKMLRALGYEI
ncbi:MAG: biotin synthase BioB [Eubacterium sp.]|nr:biotin synthase BioB [Eubacterium sp.]